ncbi:MAG: helix-turn-helix transcriptional regulator, partial [Caldilineae bacterium]
FAEVLRVRAQEEQPDQAPCLHRRASAWYAQHDLPAQAIRHALAAQDFERAAGLIELAWPAMDGQFRGAAWMAWARNLPEEVIRARPVLSVAYAWALLNGGELERAAARLQDADRWLTRGDDPGDGPRAAPSGMVVVDEEQFRGLPGSMAAARSYIALAMGDIPGAVAYAQRALDLLPETELIARGPAASLLGLAQWTNGDLDAAFRSLADAMEGFRLAGNLHFALSGTYGLADIRIVQGRLREAVGIYEQALRLATEQPGVIRGIADLYLGLSELHRERGDGETAERFLQKSEALGEEAALQDWPYRLRRAQARFAQDRGDLDGAVALLEESERLYYPTPVPDVRPLAALKARVWMAQGRLAEALAWVQERGLSVDDDLSYLREFEHITLARILLAQHLHTREAEPLQQAIRLLERLLHAAEAGGRMGRVIEISLVLALAHRAQGDISAALESLARALTLAEPEGYVRIFVDEGPPMAALLQAAAKSGLAPGYVRRLQAAFKPATQDTPNQQGLLEPLSGRELEVLRLLATELSGPEIARELVVSLNTMRTHTKNIYGKLGVNSRRAAVRRARELELL